MEQIKALTDAYVAAEMAAGKALAAFAAAGSDWRACEAQTLATFDAARTAERALLRAVLETGLPAGTWVRGEYGSAYFAVGLSDDEAQRWRATEPDVPYRKIV